MGVLSDIFVHPYGFLQPLVNIVPREAFTSVSFMEAVTLLHLRASSVGFISSVRDSVRKLPRVYCGEFCGSGYSARPLAFPDILLAAWAGVIPGSFFDRYRQHYYFDSPFTTPERYGKQGDSRLHTAVGKEVDSLAIRLGITDQAGIPAPADVVALHTDSSHPEALYAAWRVRPEEDLYLMASMSKKEDSRFRLHIVRGDVDAFLRSTIFSSRERWQLEHRDDLVSLESFGQEYLRLVEGIEF